MLVGQRRGQGSIGRYLCSSEPPIAPNSARARLHELPFFDRGKDWQDIAEMVRAGSIWRALGADAWVAVLCGSVGVWEFLLDVLASGECLVGFGRLVAEFPSD